MKLEEVFKMEAQMICIFYKVLGSYAQTEKSKHNYEAALW